MIKGHTEKFLLSAFSVLLLVLAWNFFSNDPIIGTEMAQAEESEAEGSETSGASSASEEDNASEDDEESQKSEDEEDSQDDLSQQSVDSQDDLSQPSVMTRSGRQNTATIPGQTVTEEASQKSVSGGADQMSSTPNQETSTPSQNTSVSAKPPVPETQMEQPTVQEKRTFLKWLKSLFGF